MLRPRRIRREDGEAIVGGKPRRDRDEVAQLVRNGAHAELGDDARHLLLHVMHRPRRRGSRASVERTRRDLLHGKFIQCARRSHSGAR